VRQGRRGRSREGGTARNIAPLIAILKKNINTTCDNFNDFTELQLI
jgi:hypothetical protein